MLRLRDLGSTNGTFIAGVRVVEALLGGGERVGVGESLLAIERGIARAPSARVQRTNFGRFFGASPQIRRLYPLFDRLAGSDIPVVIEGETGTGKEVLAEAIHEHSARRDRAYVVLDCTATPANLIESELFGHERGAFTGAIHSRKGVFERAHGGTLLLDEIGDLEVALQAKLLRAIERNVVQPLGSSRMLRVDVRVIAATRRDLDRAVQSGRFRDDLFHRLAVGRVELPPLRRRPADVPILAQRFWQDLGGGPSGPPPDLLSSFEEHSWPGNVRELKNAIARYLALGQTTLTAPPAPPQPSSARGFLEQLVAQRLPFPIARVRVLEEFQRRYVERLLDDYGGNVARAAEASGVARRYFQILKGGKRKR